jgi:hypothetical protein
MPHALALAVLAADLGRRPASPPTIARVAGTTARGWRYGLN